VLADGRAEGNQKFAASSSLLVARPKVEITAFAGPPVAAIASSILPFIVALLVACFFLGTAGATRFVARAVVLVVVVVVVLVAVIGTC
jgi:hypothetical protein